MKLKMKQILARILVFAMVVTGVPVAAMNGADVQNVLADENGSGAQEEVTYRYRAIPNMKVTADWDDATSGSIGNLLEDSMSWAMSRFNTGNKPISSSLYANNNIFIKADAATDVKSLRYYQRMDIAGGEQQVNGIILRVNVYAMTSQAPADLSGSAENENWKMVAKNVKFDMEHPTDEKEVGDKKYPYYDIEFDQALEGVNALRIEVLNTYADYNAENSKYENDTYISGAELEVYSDADTKVATNKLTFSADFTCNTATGDETVGKLNDGDYATNMHSTWTADASEWPQREDDTKFVSNNNMYFELPEPTLVGRLTYVTGAPNGNIARTRIYATTAQAPDGKGPEAIPDSEWKNVFDNTPDSVEEWAPYVRSGGISANDRVANFDEPVLAKYVRMEVVLTHFGAFAEYGNEHKPDNKWISGRRVYIYEAEKIEEPIENIASKNEKSGGLATTVKAYTGGANPENVIDENTRTLTNRDGVAIEVKDIDSNAAFMNANNIDDYNGANANGGTTWTSGVLMKQSGYNKPVIDGAASCIVLDLGEGTASEIENIRVRWWNWLSGIDYVIETSDTCGLSGDITTSLGTEITEQKIRDEDTKNGDEWRTVATITDGYSEPNPLHEFSKSNGNLSSISLSRYVRILITKMSTRGAGESPNMKEIEIRGRRSKKVSTVELDWHFAALEHADGDRLPTYEDYPRYGSDFRYPTAVRGASYAVNKDSQKVEMSTNGTDWTDITNTEHGFFDFGKYYRLTATIDSGSVDFADVVNVNLVKIDGTREEIEAVANSGDKKSITVSRVFQPIANYTQDYQDLGAWFKGNDSKEIRDRYAEGQGTASKRLWDAFENAYNHVEQCLLRSLHGEVLGISAPTGLRRADFDNGKQALLRAYGLLTGDVELIDQKVQIGIQAPVPGEKQGQAVPLNKGKLVLKPDTLKYEHGDQPFSIEDGGIIKGNVQFPNKYEGNQIFNVNGTTQFIMDFDISMDKAATKTETIIGRLNGQYGVQIKDGRLIVFGQTTGGSWPQTGYNIPNDFYNGWHDIVIIYDGEKFRMFVDGEAATDDRTNAHGALKNDGNNSTFGIGYNPDRRVDTSGSNHEDEWFSGQLRNVQMFVQSDGNDKFPKWGGVVTAQTPQEQETLLRNLLDSDDVEPQLEIGGEATQLYSTQTRWSPQHTTFRKYQDYTLEVTATPNEGYQFEDNLEAELSVTGQSPYAVPEGVVSVTAQSADSMTFIYTFKRPKHPVEDLDEYMEGEMKTKLKTTTPDANTNSEGRVYTKATWEVFEDEYANAKALSARLLEEGTEDLCTKALTDLRAAVNGLKEAKDYCECTITSVSLSSEDILLEASSKDVALNATYETDNTECVKHHTTGKATADITYAIAEDEDDIAEINGSTLTVKGEGTVKVTATATLESADNLESGTTEKSTDTPAVYTVTSPKVNKNDPAVSNLKEAYEAIKDAYTESNYDPATWAKLEQALKDAEKLLQALESGSVPAYQVSQALDKINGAKDDLDKKSVANLRALAKEIEGLDQKDYDANSWNAMVAIYNQAVEELNKGDNADPSKCAALLTQLKDLKGKLKLATGKPPINDPKDEVKDGQTFTLASGTYKVVSAKDKTVIITKGVDANTINVGPTVVINKDTYKVVGIDNSAFAGLKNATKVIIGDNVASIGDQAFTGCAKLKNVTIGKDVATIGRQAFFKCKKLSKVTVKNNSKLSKVGASAFKKTSKKIKIKLPKNLKKNKKLKKQIKKAGIKKGL